MRSPWAISGNVTFDVAVKAPPGLITPVLAVNSNMPLISAAVAHPVIIPVTIFTPNAQIIALSGFVVIITNVNTTKETHPTQAKC